METRLKRPIIQARIESLRAMIAHHEDLERGDSPRAQRELARLEAELQALGGS